MVLKLENSYAKEPKSINTTTKKDKEPSLLSEIKLRDHQCNCAYFY